MNDQTQDRNEAIAAVVDQHAKAVAKKWYRKGVSSTLVEDLRGDGWVYALENIEKFDATRNAEKSDAVERFLSLPLKHRLNRKAIQAVVPIKYGDGHEKRTIKKLNHSFLKARTSVTNALAPAIYSRRNRGRSPYTLEASTPMKEWSVLGIHNADALDARITKARIREVVDHAGGETATRHLLLGDSVHKIATDMGKSPKEVRKIVRSAKARVATQLNREMLEILAS